MSKNLTEKEMLEALMYGRVTKTFTLFEDKVEVSIIHASERERKEKEIEIIENNIMQKRKRDMTNVELEMELNDIFIEVKLEGEKKKLSELNSSLVYVITSYKDRQATDLVNRILVEKEDIGAPKS